MKKALKITLTTLAIIIVSVMVILLLFKLGERLYFNSFYSNAQVEFAIPGLMDGYVPQGFDYLEEEDAFLACGYMKGKSASRVYLIKRDGSYTYTELKKADGKKYTGHTGGVEYFENYLYITGSSGIDVFTLSDVVEGKSETRLLGTIDSYGVDPAHCFIYDGSLYVGSFYKAGDYDTPVEHHLTTPCGDENKGAMLSFKLDSQGTFGVNPVPNAFYSMPSFVQGACVTEDGKLVLSTSWGISVSHLYVHDLAKINSYDEKITIGGNEMALYYVDGASLVNTIDAPPMSEEIIYLEGKIWVMNESACNKYIFGKFTTGNNLYSYNYNK
ncbi:MAG: hypothetical protein J6B34_04795 [Clostridia bacterium]|nr:hypothetical protein [Clostridia bacterium]